MNAQVSPAFALRYSFVFRYQHDRVFSIDLPMEAVQEIELSVNAVRELIAEDYYLQAQLLGDYLPRYEEMAANWDYWDKNLQRERESIRIAQVEV